MTPSFANHRLSTIVEGVPKMVELTTLQLNSVEVRSVPNCLVDQFRRGNGKKGRKDFGATKLPNK